MSEIKAGEVAFIKTTGEAVFVVNIGPNNSAFPDFIHQVTVNRPTPGRDGVVHSYETFFLEELETLDSQRARFVQERQEMLAKYAPSNQQSEAPTDSGFSFN